MFWIVDSLLMRKLNEQKKSSPPTKKHKGKYNKLKNVESGSESEEGDVLYNAMDQSNAVTKQPNKSKSHRSISMNLLSKSDDR